jgi:hypothetical protein
VNSSNSGQQQADLAAAANALRPECSAFFTRLAEGTGGQVRNLWDQEALLAELKQKPITVPMSPITDDDISVARKKAAAAPVIAVLPPTVFGRPQFESGTEGAICATVAQRHLSNLGFTVRGPASIESEYEAAVTSGANPTIVQLANQISADFVLSGSVTTDNANTETQLTLNLYGRKSNKDLGIEVAKWTAKESLSVPDRMP